MNFGTAMKGKGTEVS